MTEHQLQANGKTTEQLRELATTAQGSRYGCRFAADSLAQFQQWRDEGKSKLDANEMRQAVAHLLAEKQHPAVS